MINPNYLLRYLLGDTNNNAVKHVSIEPFYIFNKYLPKNNIIINPNKPTLNVNISNNFLYTSNN